jgi:hypothetical protein
LLRRCNMFHPTRLLREMQSVGDPGKSPGLAKLWVPRECDVSCWNGTRAEDGRPPGARRCGGNVFVRKGSQQR